MDLKRRMTFIECYQSQFKDNTYTIYSFLDLPTLHLFYYSELNGDLEQFEPSTEYTTHLTVKRGKLKISNVD